MTLEANRRGVDEACLVVSPNDGADWIQGILDHIAPEAVRILDEPHAAEHLRTIGELIYGAGTTAASRWTDQQRHRLLTEPPAGVLAELARCQAQGPGPGAPPGPDGLAPADWLAREVAYFLKRADQIRYAAVRAQLYPIGSGIVESGHRVVIGARFKGAGQHWAPAHLNPVLALRTTICNDRWTATWPTVAAQRRQTTQAAGQTARRRRSLARLASCLRQLPTARPTPPAAETPETPVAPPGPPVTPFPAPAAFPPPPRAPAPARTPRLRAGPGWHRSNSLFFRPRAS